jgi:hypothetical protein
VATGKTVTSNKSDVTITAWDMDMDGSITTGTKSYSIHGAKTTQTLGLGLTAKDMHISVAEASRMTTNGGFSMASSTSG